MVWWIVAVLVIGPLLVVAAAAAGLRSRQVEFTRRARAAVRREAAQVAALQPGQQRVQAQLARLQRRALVVSQRLEQLKLTLTSSSPRS